MKPQIKIQNVYPLTPMQEGMLFHSLYNNSSSAYLEQVGFTIKGKLDIVLFEKAFNKLIERYDILRTIFKYEKVEKPLQVVLSERPTKINYEDISGLEENEQEFRIEAFKKQDKERGFDLSKNILTRITVFRKTTDEYKIIWSHHHILMDGWCMGIIIKEFFTIYNSMVKNTALQLDKVEPYSKYISWLDQRDREASATYWRNYLSEYTNLAVLPQLTAANKNEYVQGHTRLVMDTDISSRFQKIATDNKVTFNVLLQSVWGLLLQRYNNTNDAVFGSVVSGRPAEIEGVERMVGLFINTIPVRIKALENDTFTALIKRIQINAVESTQHDYYPLADIQAQSEMKGELINNLMVFENFPIGKEIEKRDAQVSDYQIQDVETYEQTNYELVVVAYPGDEISLKFEYNTNVYSSEIIEKIKNHFSNIIKQVVQNPAIKLNELDMLTIEENNYLYKILVDTATNYPKDKTLQTLFEEQVNKTPDNIAVKFEKNTITYSELNKKANQLADLLITKGVKPNDIVGLMTHKSVEMLVGILGILKAGAAYLPLDPGVPQQRTEYMLSDTKANLLVIQKELTDIITFGGTKVLLGDEYGKNEKNPQVKTDTSAIANVIYTSGSTGMPKGALVTHSNVSRVVLDTNYIQITPEDKILQLSNYAFDGSTFDIYGALLNGATLVLPNKEEAKDSQQLADLLIREKITILFTTTVLFNALADTNVQALKGLRKLLFGGERVSVKHAQKALKEMGPGKMLHMYGPTESTVYTTYYPIQKIENDAFTIPIGKPLSNTEVYVLTTGDKLQTIGAPGELCVGGAGLIREYLNQPELTAAKFIENPFKKGEKIYRSGDLVKVNEQGDIEFLDRIDKQVKIRGYRIELGEIENKLLEYPQVKETVVVALGEGSDKYLCAYIVADSKIEIADVKKHLSKSLSDFLIPSQFVQMEKFPLTMSGKINTKALPLPAGGYVSAAEYVAPANETEEKLAAVWKEVLGVEKIGTKDNFFDLGGHSLKATVLVSRINKLYEKQLVGVADVFHNPTIQALSIIIDGGSEVRYENIQAAPVKEYYDLSYAQKQLWLQAQMNPENTSYNIAGAITLEGKLNTAALEKAFATVIDRYEALRTRFEIIEGEAKQKIVEIKDFKLPVEKSGAETETKKKVDAVAHTVFDLTKAPLIHVKLIQESEQKHILAFAIHHIIGDGWSMQVIQKEVIGLYNAYANNEKNPLKPNTLQFKDYVNWENNLLTPEKLNSLQQFWKNHFGQKINPVNLPIDKIRPIEQSFNGNTISSELDAALAKQLSELAKNNNTTLNVLFLGLFNIFLSKISGDSEVVVRSITTGRNHADLENMVGYFVRVFGIKNAVSGETTFRNFTTQVKERYLQVMQNDLYPFEKILDEYRNAEAKGNLINVSYAMQNLGSMGAMQTGDSMGSLKVNPYGTEGNTAKNDLLLTVYESGESISYTFNYNTDLFVDSKIKLFISWFNTLLKQAAANPDKKINELRLSTGQETELFEHLGVSKEVYESIHPLTTVQRDLYLDSVFNPDDAAHSLAFYIELTTDLAVDKWTEAMQLLVDASPALKTELIINENDVYQGVKNKYKLKTKLIDISKEKADFARVEQIIDKEAKIPYNFETDALMRHVLIKQADNKYYSLLCAHHVIFDGWSIKLLFEKTAKIYQSLVATETVNVVKDAVFFDYVQQHLARFDTPETEAYWKKKLGDTEPLHFSGTKAKNAELISKQQVLTAAQLKAIETYCAANKLSVSLYLKSLFVYIIKNYCRAESDFTIRELLGGREQEHLQAMGCFYHSIPLCMDINVFKKDTEVINYFNYVKNQKKELGGYQNVSFLMQNKLIGEEEIVFYFNYQTYFQLDIFNTTIPLKSINTYSENQIQLLARETAEGLRLILDYDARYFADFNFIDRLLALSEQITSGAKVLGELQLVSEAEKKQMTASKPLAKYPEKATIQELFEKAAATYPDRIAVSCEGRTISYKELNEQSNRLANYISQQQKIQFDDLIGVYMNRSEKMIVSILAVLKTGGAYVPIDPDYPTDRVLHMVNDSKIKLLVKADGLELTDISCKVVDTDHKTNEIKNCDAANPTNKNKPQDIAYIIYTSGSTGLPKGTMVEHRNVVQLLFNDAFQFDFNENDVWTVFHSFCFDFSVWEMYGALLRGGKAVVVPKETAQNSAAFLNLVQQEKVTVLNQIPSLFNNLVNEALKAKEKNLGLRYVIFGGEALKPGLLKEWHNTYPATKLINMYGITETTVHVTYKEITSVEIEKASSNIGKPLPTLSCIIMNDDMELVPDGVAGEICVGGAGVSRGYLYKEELTAQRFVENPFDKKQKLYKSGDLGRILENGDIEYLGRKDHQVKVRGYRIELGEIENKLNAHTQIQEAIVIAKELTAGENELIAYIKTTADLQVGELRTLLKSLLPDYMVPAYFVLLAEFPVTPSGKIDKKALPNPVEGGINTGREYVAASNAIEEQLCSLWMDILGRTKIGVHDNFFEIGGHSLKATQLINKIHKFLHVEITIRELFANPTVSGLATLITGKEKQIHTAITPAPKAAYYDVSHAQWRLWILCTLEKNTTEYNMPKTSILEGDLNTEAFKKTFDTIIQRHESLRTTFITVEGEPKQVIHDTISFNINEIDLSKSDNQEAALKKLEEEDFRYLFDLEKGPLLRATLAKLDNQKYAFFFNMHHIISDGWSMGVMMKEIFELYDAYSKGADNSLPALPIQYKDYAVWQHELLNGEFGNKAKSYWHKKLSGEIVPLDMPTNFDRPERLSHIGENVSFEFTTDESEKIRAFCKERGISVFIFSQAVVKILLHRYSYQNDIIIGSPIAGRGHEDLMSQVGFFVNMLVLRDEILKEDTFEQVLEKVKKTTLEAYEYELYPYDKLVEELKVPRKTNRSPLFDVSLVMVNKNETKKVVSKGIKVSNPAISFQSTKDDLTFVINEDDNIHCTIQYDVSLYKYDSIVIMANMLKTVIEQVLENNTIEVSKIKLEEGEAVNNDMDTSLDFNF